ncbi:hypothetical protein [Oceanispirochaeta sp.]|jgi:hypothetical protein|uniref:hypothetical protein n=1 Tax=Oceanispirochaeta sp. TaxID=2035350 RepID=UPI00262709AB|nr:hypothetical protein [Oceanispirochaeta sp.]MDA3957839.1 hypothetical protein [Oceanispirochaeta sp.]
MKMNKGILPLSVGGGAALVSVLTGLISEVSPGMMLVRGLFSAMTATAFVFMAGWLFKTYLPELGQSEDNKSSDENQNESMGKRVNIVMQDEMSEPGNQENSASRMSLSDIDDPSGSSEKNEIAETAENVHNNKPEDPDIGSAAAVGLDTLPNLDSLEISIGSSSEQMESGDNFETAAPEAPITIRKGTIDPKEQGDPSDIAKAVRTVLARDKQK